MSKLPKFHLPANLWAKLPRLAKELFVAMQAPPVLVGKRYGTFLSIRRQRSPAMPFSNPQDLCRLAHRPLTRQQSIQYLGRVHPLYPRLASWQGSGLGADSRCFAAGNGLPQARDPSLRPGSAICPHSLCPDATGSWCSDQQAEVGQA